MGRKQSDSPLDQAEGFCEGGILCVCRRSWWSFNNLPSNTRVSVRGCVGRETLGGRLLLQDCIRDDLPMHTEPPQDEGR